MSCSNPTDILGSGCKYCGTGAQYADCILYDNSFIGKIGFQCCSWLPGNPDPSSGCSWCRMGGWSTDGQKRVVRCFTPDQKSDPLYSTRLACPPDYSTDPLSWWITILNYIIDGIMWLPRRFCQLMRIFLKDALPQDWSIPWGLFGKLASIPVGLYCWFVHNPILAGIIGLMLVTIYFIFGNPGTVLIQATDWILN